MEELKKQKPSRKKLIPVGISNRHVHLSSEHMEVLFGQGAQLTYLKDLSQPGQYACQETITLVGPKGVLEKVRVLGPARKSSQVEISISDCFKLGIKAPIRDSGDLKGSAAITLVGSIGSVTIPEGCIIANRHIHMHTDDANRFGLSDGQRVSVRAKGPRSVTFAEVLVRISEKYKLEIHLDMDEANAVGIRNGDFVQLVK
jgi:putative phosphotransacetylase